jgi:chemotaxis protein histidine kinase CheA
VHNLESKIKKLREMEGEVPFSEMLELTMDIEKISKEKDGFKDIIDKLKTYTEGDKAAAVTNKKQNVTVMVESLTKAANKAGEDTGKMIQFIANDIDQEALEKGPRREMKEILMQLIRNSAVHGIETPEIRKKRGKNETGIVKMSIKMAEDKKSIIIKLQDDGGGLDYKKIGEKAVSKKLLKPEEADNIDMLTKVIFAPGFSTAETEGIHAGRGIGLNLVRDRLKEIKGSVKLKSEAGKGTLFMLVVPAVPSKN